MHVESTFQVADYEICSCYGTLVAYEILPIHARRIIINNRIIDFRIILI